MPAAVARLDFIESSTVGVKSPSEPAMVKSRAAKLTGDGVFGASGESVINVGVAVANHGHAVGVAVGVAVGRTLGTSVFGTTGAGVVGRRLGTSVFGTTGAGVVGRRLGTSVFGKSHVGVPMGADL